MDASPDRLAAALGVSDGALGSVARRGATSKGVPPAAVLRFRISSTARAVAAGGGEAARAEAQSEVEEPIARPAEATGEG